MLRDFSQHPAAAADTRAMLLVFWVANIAIISGCVTAIVAGEKRRSALGWFAIGALWPLLGLILALALPPMPEG